MDSKYCKEFFKDGKHGDISLKIAHERKLRVHRSVLASFSPYFKAVLGDNWEEGRRQEIEILGLDENAVSDLIEFAYSGKISIDIDNVKYLLEAANYLCVESVKKSCGDFLKDGLDHKTCLGVWKLADVFALEELGKIAKLRALRNFADVCKEKEFLCLPVRFLINLLSDEELCVVIEDLIPCTEEREKVVLEAVFQYIGHDVEGRQDHLPKLLYLVRLPTLSESYLKEVSTHKFVDGTCKEILEKALRVKLDPHEKDLSVEKWAVPREFAKLVVMWGRCFANGGHVKPEILHCTDIHAFEDLEEEHYVTGMELWFRRWDGRSILGDLKVYYNHGYPMTFGDCVHETEQQPWQHYEFHLDKDERITDVEVSYGKLINKLKFYTNKNNADSEQRHYGPYGDEVELYDWELPEASFAYLAGISGAVVRTHQDTAITRLQFAWRGYVLPGDPVPMKNYCRVRSDSEDGYDDDGFSDEYDYEEDYDLYEMQALWLGPLDD